MLLDEDVKIYRGDEDDQEPVLGEGERSAALFLRHKENGNLAKCRELGTLLGKTFAGDAQRFSGDPYARQKLVLLSFVVSDELAGIIFDQMLQKSALSVFGQTVERCDPALAASIGDSTAFTLYILDDRQGGDDRLGRTFAELCGKEGDHELTEIGNTLAADYRRLCADIISSYNFAEI